MAENRMPNMFYSYEASYPINYPFDSYARQNHPNNDSGVFVLDGYGAANGFGPKNCIINASNGAYMGSVSGPTGSYGGINMCTINDTAKYWTFGVGLDTTSPDYPLCLLLWRGKTTTKAISTTGDIYSESKFKYTQSSNLSVSVYKTEATYRKSPLEYAYITGLSAIAFTKDGNIYGHETMILARAVPTDGTGYPTLGAISGITGEYCTDASVVFSDTGKILGILESNDAAAVTSTSISTAFPEESLSANDGVIAVSCMAGVDGKACWMGYKNGVYKLYHGSKPLYGMPGGSIAIKGHEFRCLAYSPFYVRMS